MRVICSMKVPLKLEPKKYAIFIRQRLKLNLDLREHIFWLINEARPREPTNCRLEGALEKENDRACL